MPSEVAELERAVDHMPDGWTSRRLLDICRPRQWPTISREQFTDNGFPVYGANGQIGLYSQFTHDSETIAITCRGATCGTINLVPAKSYITGNAMALDNLDNSLVAQSYLYQALQHWGVANSISGSAQPQITRQSLNHVAFPFPPLDEQRRIAEVLRSVDEAIAAAQDVATSMERASRTMRHELLNVAADGTISELPTEWDVLPLEVLASVERGKFSIRPRNDPRYFGGATPFIQTGDITSSDGYIVRHTQTLNELGVGVSRVFPAGTIMTTIAANIGDFAIATYPVACPDSVVGIEAVKGVDAFWLYSVLTCFKVALDRASTQNAQKNINLQTLRPLQIPVPPRALMIELAETLAAAADGARQAKAAIENLTTLKRSIQGDLLSGNVRVPA